VDPNKIQSMQHWPRSKTLKILWVFFGLTGYYRNFFHHYGKIAKPLMDLLKKNAFQWTPAVEQNFLDLKYDMCTTDVLAVHGFNKTFVVESDASSIGISVVLTQDDQTIAFTSQDLSGHNSGKSTYEK
jgi:hypothetical protein